MMDNDTVHSAFTVLSISELFIVATEVQRQFRTVCSKCHGNKYFEVHRGEFNVKK